MKDRERHDFEYDVAISFAGPDRAHARRLSEKIQDQGAKVFYDEFEQVNLWGKDLYQHLQKVYRDKAAFCVIFLSKDYQSRAWPKHELEQAQAREFREGREYILPLKLDDTEVPGVNPTTGYLDLDQVSIDEVVDLLLDKISSFIIESSPHNYKLDKDFTEIKIEDPKGRKAVCYSKSKMMSLNDGLEHYTWGLRADGSLDLVNISPGNIISKSFENGYIFHVMKLPNPISLGQEISRRADWKMLNSFTESQEYFIIDQTTPMDEFVLRVVFPESRPCIDSNGIVQMGHAEKLHPKQPEITSKNGKYLLQWKVQNPDSSAQYKLTWEW